MNLAGRSLLVDKVASHFEGKPFTQALFVVSKLWQFQASSKLLLQQILSKFKTLSIIAGVPGEKP